MSTLNRSRVASLAATLLAVLGMLAMGLFATPHAYAADGSATNGTITLEPAEGDNPDLQYRSFQAWEPMRITAQDNSGGITVDITDGYLPYVRTAAANRKLPVDTDTSNGKIVTEASSEDDVVEAISHLAQRQKSKQDDTEANAFANELRTVLVKNQVKAEKSNEDFTTLADGGRQLTGLDYGWYLIEETTGNDPEKPSATPDNSSVSLVMTTPVSGPVTIHVKSKAPESHKNIVDADHSNQRKADVVNENTDIHYQLTFYVPAQWSSQFKDTGFWFTMNDTLDKGLVFDHADYAMVGNDFTKTDGDRDFSKANGLYDFSLEPTQGSADGKTTLTWTFGDPTGKDLTNNITNKDLAGKWVKLYYTAHLSQDAPINEAVGNAYDVTYQHSPYTTQGGEKTPTEHPYVYTYNLAVSKIDGADSKALSGAQFEMYSDKDLKNIVKFTKNGSTYEYDPNGKETTLTTGDDGKIEVEGVTASVGGTHYYLKEVKAPSGYRSTSAVIDATLKLDQFDTQASKTKTDGTTQDLAYTLAATGGYSQASNNVLVIKNYKGLLPSTGAQGIILTSILGILLIGGGALALRRNR